MAASERKPVPPTQAPTSEPANRFKALVAHDYEIEGVHKTRWTQIGVAFKSRNGAGINVVITPGLSVAGQIVLMPWDRKTDNEDQGAEEEAGFEIPSFHYDPTASNAPRK